jgi:[acyl-carrier-protein] S-malonyltransferase
MNIAVLFPGQGSQYPGMADPWTSHPLGRAVLDEAAGVLGWDVVEASRDEERLAETAVVQPALFTCDLAAFRVLEAEGLRFSAAAGHSLGEFVALVAAGAAEPGPMLQVVADRGRATAEASADPPGAMTALVGLGREEAEDICLVAGRGDVLTVANENSPKQVVISGGLGAVEAAEDLARSRGGRSVRLKVAGAFHSPLMRPALDRVRAAIAKVPLKTPRFPVVPNASGRPTTQPAAMRDLLSRHLVSPVRWDRSVKAMADLGAELFVEAGPGDVLSKLVKRNVPGARAVSVGSPAEAQALAAELGVRA